MTNTKPKRQKKIPVMELFGPTIQGEGMVIGRKTMFLRTGGCDYSCAWCDSSFTWNGEERATLYTPAEIFDKLIEEGTSADGKRNFNHVTISGGNPALFKDPMADLIIMLHDEGIQVGLETQGSIWQDWMYQIDDLTISPKPPSSKMVTDFDKLDHIIANLEGSYKGPYKDNHSLKVVVFDDADFEYAKKVHQRYPEVTFYVSVGNADAHEEGPIANRLLDKLEWLWNKVLEDPEANDFRPLPQLHTLVWDNTRGV